MTGLRQASRGTTSTASAALYLAVLCLLAASGSTYAQSVDVSARFELRDAAQKANPKIRRGDLSGVVLWLSPKQHVVAAETASHVQQRTFALVQKDRQFNPHLLVVPLGSSVEFPNLDPFFHNVFSLYNGKRFDLGLYEAHTHRSVRFDREGVSYIFCNIHPQMGAVVLALSTPFFGVSQDDGRVLIRNVPPGAYRLHVWAEDVSNDQLAGVERDLLVDGAHAHLETIRLDRSGNLMQQHGNKFGNEYSADPKPVY